MPPVGPVAPEAPLLPVGPGAPVAPVAPVGPVAPVAPVAPDAPLLLDGRPVPPQPGAPDAPLRAEGWHAPEPGLHWTNGAASLRLPPSANERSLELLTAPLLRYWLPPQTAAGMAAAA